MIIYVLTLLIQKNGGKNESKWGVIQRKGGHIKEKIGIKSVNDKTGKRWSSNKIETPTTWL